MNVLIKAGIKKLNIPATTAKFSPLICSKFEIKRYTSSNSFIPRIPIIGNKYFQPFVDRVVVKRWKRHWMLTMKHKANLEGPKPGKPRCNEPNWNLDVELNAFNKRLQLNIPDSLLCAAFTEPIPVEDNEKTCNNDSLVKFGKAVVDTFLHNYVSKYFPTVSNQCHDAIVQYLSSEHFTAHLACNLGIVDFIQSLEYPFVEMTKSRCFFSTVASIYCGNNGPVEAAKFIQDFVVSDLIDKDIVADVWKPENPMSILAHECEKRNWGVPEIRLTKQSGIASTLPVYFIGLFIDKELYAESGGETLPLAETDVAKLALKKLYNLSVENVLITLNMENDELASLMPYFKTDELFEEYFTLNEEETNEENSEMKNQ